MSVQIAEIYDPGFHSAIVYEGWKVAMFNSDSCWDSDSISYLQKHENSDEVFILLKGSCTLILSDEEKPVSLYGIKMEPLKIYNVPKGMWHSHVLEEGTSVIVVENSDTTPENSPKVALPYPLDLSTIEYR